MSTRHRENPPYWPGGIPPHIRCHPQPIPGDDIQDEIKGWLLFLDENVDTRPAGHAPRGQSKLHQRRALMSRWACLDQATRDAYQARAPTRDDFRPPPAYYKKAASEDGDDDEEDSCVSARVVHCLAAHPMSGRSRAAWTKLRILLYRLDGAEDGPTIDGGGGDDDGGEATVCVPNPAAGPGTSVAPGQDFLSWRYVEGADFHGVAMTGAGTAVFPSFRDRGPFVLADQTALDTGLLLLCECANNGQLEAQVRIRPYQLYEVWNLVSPYVLNKSVKEVVTSRDHLRFEKPLNMEQPILDILEDCKPYLDGGIDEWMDDIERYAPGYLAMEEVGNGQAPDYDCSNLRGEEELSAIPRQEFDNTRA